MANYINGPLHGRNIVTAYDHLPVILFPWPDNCIQNPDSVLSYELLRDGQRYFKGSSNYPRPGMTATHPTIRTHPTQEADK